MISRRSSLIVNKMETMTSRVNKLTAPTKSLTPSTNLLMEMTMATSTAREINPQGVQIDLIHSLPSLPVATEAKAN